jgi:hypothetical protein
LWRRPEEAHDCPVDPIPLTPMPTPRRRFILLAASLLLAGAPGSAAAADCELAQGYASAVADNGRRAMATQNYLEASHLASDARIPAIDAAQQAKACGCPEAMPFLAEAARDAARVNLAANLTAMQQFGAGIRKNADAAIAALRRCATR